MWVVALLDSASFVISCSGFIPSVRIISLAVWSLLICVFCLMHRLDAAYAVEFVYSEALGFMVGVGCVFCYGV